ncbi:alpha/beta hydrolase [Duganella sp. sic0402]|uniref:alpha/beta hydrolase n=1 Tax=Duganella sp. sic0402 TaxID=2854786 RepID=UPI001C46E85E|nr:alpha/beta hydrolase [Duganella sp. sic0402]MBV7534342.1 alpha/beta hydrolase [Duganella sp. sic0402]
MLPSLINLPALDNRRVKTSHEDVLVDQVIPGEILVIAFGFVSWETRPDFDFYGRLKKLEQASGRHINKILVRDSGNAWYHRKIAGLGEHPDETAAGLRVLIDAIRPSKVITIGQSMGAYAALMYGLLLEVQQVVAFGPLSFLDPQQALLYHERRWLSVMRDLAARPPASGYYDLQALGRARAGKLPDMHILFGTKPDKDGASESVNLDAMHAHRLAAAGNCTLYPFPYSGHTVVQHLIDTKRINATLAHIIMGLTLPEEAREVTPDWHGWIADNLRLGGTPDELVEILKQHGFSDASSRAAIANMQS